MSLLALRVNRFEVIEAENAEDALRAFETATFDGGIVDIFLDACGSIGSLRCANAHRPRSVAVSA